MALITLSDLRKVRLTALIIVIETEEKSQHALSGARNFPRIARNPRIEIIVVRLELLARRVVQDRRRLHRWYGQSGHRGDARADEEKHEVAFIGPEMAF